MIIGSICSKTFYNSFTTYNEQYYNPTIDSLKQAQKINPISALISYFLGTVYEKQAFWSKAAASDVSDITGTSGGYKVKTNGIALQYFTKLLRLTPVCRSLLSSRSSL